MLSGDVEKLYPSAKALVKDCVASRIHAKDASLYDFSEEARACSEQYMGWTDLASNSPYSLRDIQNFADSIIAQGLKTVVLIGQGGSTQAPMTITKYNKPDSSKITFKTLDSDSPVRVRAILAEAKPETTLFVISSKSGGTIEPRLALRAVRDAVADRISEEELVQHLVAITDPGSMLERQAREEGWAAVFSGQPTVGGRFSALSVFGLLPAALVGIDLEEFMAHAIDAERQCSEDAIDNPAIGLASFLYDNYLQGRNKFTFLTQKRGRVLGLWIEQLVAESLGKDGQGILPNIEVDSLLLKKDPGDRSAIVYLTRNDLWDERRNFEMSLSYIDPAIPRANYKIDSVEELAEHFVMWEYAIAMCGYLMKICPSTSPTWRRRRPWCSTSSRRASPSPTSCRISSTRCTWARWKCACLRASKIAPMSAARCVRCWAAFNRAISSRSTRSCRSRARVDARRWKPSVTAWLRSAAWYPAWKWVRATCTPRASCTRAARTAACSSSCRPTS